MSRNKGAQKGRAAAGESKQPQRSGAEWITLAISAGVVLALVGLLLYQQFTGSGRPARIVVEPQTAQAEQRSADYYLPVVIHNRGDEAVTDVRAEISLAAGDEEPEVAEFAVLFLNGQSSASSVAVFHHDPAAGELTVTSISYNEP